MTEKMPSSPSLKNQPENIVLVSGFIRKGVRKRTLYHYEWQSGVHKPYFTSYMTDDGEVWDYFENACHHAEKLRKKNHEL